MEARQGLKIGSPEEAAHRMGFIDDDGIRTLASGMGRSAYGEYLLGLIGSVTPAP